MLAALRSAAYSVQEEGNAMQIGVPQEIKNHGYRVGRVFARLRG